MFNDNHKSQSFPAGATPAPAQQSSQTPVQRYAVGPRTPVRPAVAVADAASRIADYLRKLIRDEFYGSVTIQLRQGHVDVIRTESTLKLHDVPAATMPSETVVGLGTGMAVAGGNDDAR